MKKIYLTIISLLTVMSLSFSQTVYYVDGDISSSGTGTSWETAFKTIQEGIDAAHNSLSNPAIETAQVWVKSGTYFVYNTSEEDIIAMKEGVEIFGGFIGNETQISERNYIENETIIDGHQSAGSTNQVKHVVAAYGIETSTDVWNDWTNGKIDGFTIRGGKITTGPPVKKQRATNPEEILESGDQMSGAGILIFKCAPSILNCKITGNVAGKGGGIYVMSASTHPQIEVPVAHIINCEISDNLATMRGGGVSIDLNSEPIFERCKFINNICSAKGGGVYIDWVCPQPVFINCLFAENYAARAGAMGADGSSSPLLINCTITNNSTLDIGAGIYTGSYNPDGTDSNEPVLVNCIVSQNSADWGGAVDLRIWHDDYFHISHSILGQGFTSFGTGIIYDAPTFLDFQNGNYMLAQNSVGINSGVTNDILIPNEFSVPEVDINGNPRDENPDIGCFEFVENENLPPVAVCQDITVYLDEAGETEISYDLIDNQSYDNDDGIETYEIDINNFDCSDIGENNVVLTVIDYSSVSSNCNSIVTVLDEIIPTINCIENQTINLQQGENVFIVQGTEFDPIDFFDNCEIESIENNINGLTTLEEEEFSPGIYTITWTITDFSGNSTDCSFELIVTEFTNLENIDNSNFYIYPNPAESYISIDLQNDLIIFTIEIYDFIGKKVYQGELSSNKKIDISYLEKGCYIVKLIGNGEVFQKAILIQ